MGGPVKISAIELHQDRRPPFCTFSQNKKGGFRQSRIKKIAEYMKGIYIAEVSNRHLCDFFVCE